MRQLVFHIGYPKTATTTLQVHLFPQHPQIDYLGKFVPGHRYRDERIFPLVDALMSEPETTWTGGLSLKGLIGDYRRASERSMLLLSSENFLHVSAIDLAIVARRLACLFPGARIVVTLREQIDLLKSFFRNDGCFGNYLFITREESEKVEFPLEESTWMNFLYRNFWKNILPTLHYESILKEYDDLFGEENVCVLLYEDYATDSRKYFQQLCEFLTIDVDIAFNLVDGRRENVGLTVRQMAQRRRRSAIADPGAIVAVGYEHVPREAERPDDPPYVVRIEEPWLSMTRDLYRDGNRSLAARRGLPLAHYGYAS